MKRPTHCESCEAKLIKPSVFGGVRRFCDDCRVERNAKWAREHPDYFIAKAAEWYARNRKNNSEWREKNKRRAKAWRRKNREHIRVYNRTRRPEPAATELGH